jgi:hypothetical protein
LDLRGASIVGTPLVFPDQTRFPLSGNSHLLPRLLHLGWLWMLPREAKSSHRVCYNSAYKM